MATPHNEARPGDFAKTVLMPGDPLRSRLIAETYLTEPRLVNNVRGVQGYTGSWKGVPVSVMASGMGMPSMGIYSYELFHAYDVDNIIRIGSAGAINPKLELGDVVLAQAACTDSNFGGQYRLDGVFAPIADFQLLSVAARISAQQGIHAPVGNVLSSDRFYNKADTNLEWGAMGVLAVEMEAAALYYNAAEAGKRGLAMFTISDHLITGEAMSAQERQTTFDKMIRLALDTAAAMDN